MDRVIVALMIVLAGCAGAPQDPLAGVDPSRPLYQGAGVHLLGEPPQGQPDAQVLSADCARRAAFAYTFNATQADGSVPDSVTIATPLEPPNATLFFIAAFVEGPGGLEVAALWKGGSGAQHMQVYRLYVGEWLDTFPESFVVPLQDGIGRVAIGCDGDAAINYVVGAEEAKRPGYLEPVVADHFDLFAAVGSVGGWFISIPPSGVPSTAIVWTTMGAIDGRHDETVTAGVRVGTTEIRWSAGKGWSTVACGHEGWEEHGFMRYEGDLHGFARESETPMAWSIATLGLSQYLLFGDLLVSQAGGGDEAGSFLFSVDHVASADLLYATFCHGLHIATSLDMLFGAPAAAVWLPPEGLL